MQSIDTEAIDTLGIPRLLLMEYAGLAVARCARTLLPRPTQPIMICCGSGFNGGDGLAAARHLHDWGYRLHLLLTARRRDQLRGEPVIYATILERLGLSLRAVTASELSDGAIEPWMAACGLVIDALLGIGVRGPVREPMRSLILRMNAARKPIVAVDVPSGLDADTGAVHGVAVKATCTVTFGLPKHGCFIHQGPAHVGSLRLDPISLPRHLLEPEHAPA
jgi:NAD(P)H-hydrate epimerase